MSSGCGGLTFVYVTMATNGYVRQNLTGSPGVFMCAHLCEAEKVPASTCGTVLLCFYSPLEMIAAD